MLNGLSITEAMWTHPAVLQAVGELLIDAGVNGSDIYIVDSLWDTGPDSTVWRKRQLWICGCPENLGLQHGGFE